MASIDLHTPTINTACLKQRIQYILLSHTLELSFSHSRRDLLGIYTCRYRHLYTNSKPIICPFPTPYISYMEERHNSDETWLGRAETLAIAHRRDTSQQQSSRPTPFLRWIADGVHVVIHRCTPCSNPPYLHSR